MHENEHSFNFFDSVIPAFFSKNPDGLLTVGSREFP